MKLVLMRRKGFDIPTALPEALLQQQQQEQSELLATPTLPTNYKFACFFSEAVEKQQAPPVKSERGRSKAEAKTATQAEQPEPSLSDITGPLPTKREDTVDEILVEIGNQDSDTGNSKPLKCVHSNTNSPTTQVYWSMLTRGAPPHPLPLPLSLLLLGSSLSIHLGTQRKTERTQL